MTKIEAEQKVKKTLPEKYRLDNVLCDVSMYKGGDFNFHNFTATGEGLPDIAFDEEKERWVKVA